MEIIVTARDDSVTNASKKHAREKADKLLKIFDGITKLELILGPEGSGFRAEVVASLAKSDPLTTHVDHESMRAAIDLAVDSAQRVLVKHKEKVRDHHRGEGLELPPEKDPDEDLDSYQDVIEKRDF